MVENQEVLEGYIVDLSCLRKYPQKELFQRARTHSKECALMGHCLESGYGVVDENAGLTVLDSKATPQVFDAVRKCEQKQGIRLQIVRELKEGEMQTRSVQLISS